MTEQTDKKLLVIQYGATSRRIGLVKARMLPS